MLCATNNTQVKQYNFNKKRFAEAVKTNRRVYKDVTLRSAAKAIGVNHVTLSRCENGNTVDMKTFIAVCNWLKQSPMNFIENK